MKYLILTISILYTSLAQAYDTRPSLFISREVETTSDEIRLGDISTIKGNEIEFAKLITDLKSISFGPSPRPLGVKTIRGEEILSAIEARGIPRDAFGYSLPVTVEIKRAGRVLKNEEVVDSVRDKLNKNPELDLQIRNIVWDTEQVIPLGMARIESELLGSPVSGKLPMRVSVFIGDQLSSRFLATAQVDDWKAIPVLRTKVERGMLINSSDLQMVRTNLASLPNDIALTVEEVSGRRVTKSILNGEPVRRSNVDIPPLVEKGKLVRMRFQSGGFTAVATGVANGAGQLNDEIEIRNDRSNKIVKGKIISQDEVLVKN